jgi:protein-S-isoprenylcysteine O-methyltransferase Ste14
MSVLVVVSFVLASALVAMAIYLGSRPPGMSVAGARKLQLGLRLGAASSVAIVLLYILQYFHPVMLGRNAPFVLFAFLGNLVNFVALVNCLREISAEGLVAACLLGLEQLLWMVYALLAFADF